MGANARRERPATLQYCSNDDVIGSVEQIGAFNLDVEVARPSQAVKVNAHRERLGRCAVERIRSIRTPEPAGRRSSLAGMAAGADVARRAHRAEPRGHSVLSHQQGPTDLAPVLRDSHWLKL
jgi:hypothetical protein